MKAEVQYNDFRGTVAADISDLISGTDNLNAIGKWFDLDETRFKLIGISIYGTYEFSVSLLCVDRLKSVQDNEHIVSLSLGENSKKILSKLFKRLNIMLHNANDVKYLNPQLTYNEEGHFNDFHDEQTETS